MFASKDAALDALGRVEGFAVDAIANRLTYASGAGTPSSTSTVPEFIGQFYLDTTNENWYLAVDTANAADFKQITN